MGNKRKGYYNGGGGASEKKAKLKFGHTKKIGANMKGFLITYNSKFTFMLNEAKKLIQQFSISTDNPPTAQNSGTDLEKQLQAELDSLNDKDKEFSIYDTGAKYSIFIGLDSVDPNLVVESIFEHIEKTQKPLGRHVQRILPILNTCKAYEEDISKCVKETFDELEAVKASESAVHKENSRPIRYYCVFKSSNNGTLSRDNIFKLIGSYLTSKNIANRVDFANPDYVILINVVCSICFISFVKNFEKYRKLNLVEMGAKFGSATKAITQEDQGNKEEEQDVDKVKD